MGLLSCWLGKSGRGRENCSLEPSSPSLVSLIRLSTTGLCIILAALLPVRLLSDDPSALKLTTPHRPSSPAGVTTGSHRSYEGLRVEPAHCRAALQARARFFLGAVALDIGAHWVQMYASLISKATSHKDVAAANNPLLRLYYSNRNFMGSLCIGAEFFYIVRLVIVN